MPSLSEVQSRIKSGEIVLIYHYEEAETSMIVPGELLTMPILREMMKFAASDVSVSVEQELADKLGMTDLIKWLEPGKAQFPVLAKMLKASSNFGGSFDYKSEHTGSSDNDNIKLINTFAQICRDSEFERFQNEFETPGHIKFYIARSPLLQKRTGHTDLSVALMKMAGFTGVAAMASMADHVSGEMTSVKYAENYAKQNNLLFLEEKEIIALYEEFLNSQ
jgi:3,4-dihydroxy 2-butanone 4-phosphate synthase